MDEGARSKTRLELHAGKRRSVWTASSHKTGPKWVCRGLIDLSTMSNGSTNGFGKGRSIYPPCSMAAPQSFVIGRSLARWRCFQPHFHDSTMCIYVNIAGIPINKASTYLQMWYSEGNEHSLVCGSIIPLWRGCYALA